MTPCDSYFSKASINARRSVTAASSAVTIGQDRQDGEGVEVGMGVKWNRVSKKAFACTQGCHAMTPLRRRSVAGYSVLSWRGIRARFSHPAPESARIRGAAREAAGPASPQRPAGDPPAQLPPRAGASAAATRTARREVEADAHAMLDARRSAARGQTRGQAVAHLLLLADGGAADRRRRERTRDAHDSSGEGRASTRVRVSRLNRLMP